MPLKKCPSLLLLLALLAFAVQPPPLALAQTNANPVQAHRSETRENPPQVPQSSPAEPPTDGPAPRTGAQERSEEASASENPAALFDAFPAAAAKRPIQARAVSENVAAQLAARMPQYTPPPEPKPQPKAEDATDGELADLRDEDRPQNQILRLPDYVVREKKAPVFRERDIYSPSGLAALAANRYLSETGQALNRFRLPLIGSGAQAYALARYEEDERLRTIRDLTDTARDLGRLQNAETAPGGTAAAPTWDAPPASNAASARRATDAEAALRRLIRDTTSRRPTESPSKLPR